MNEFRVWDTEEHRYVDSKKFAISGDGVLMHCAGGLWLPVIRDCCTIERQAGETYDGKPVFDGDMVKRNNCKEWEAESSDAYFALAIEDTVIGTIHDKPETASSEA